ncbi:hypothetical protein [Guptibacillus hwajinpoensis]|uniref:Uncharacterized protein n=1 Tax=Guptibacillus hwajinpoensis TaxID=208199 RepID=A0A0J6CL25_9BACL|nr:hypothetical protein [Alkalihalobacillus macyae]KMM36936.1 hypothetical protein AB986_13570 [Alkalihalobacillus macyae]
MHEKQEIEILCDALRTYWNEHPEKNLGHLLKDLHDKYEEKEAFEETEDLNWLHWMLENSKQRDIIEKKYRNETQISNLEKHIRPELIEVIRRFVD